MQRHLMKAVTVFQVNSRARRVKAPGSLKACIVHCKLIPLASFFLFPPSLVTEAAIFVTIIVLFLMILGR